MTVRVAPRPEGLGAEITGVDVAAGLEGEDLAAVKAAFAAHGVIWFPDQPLSHDALEAFTLAFGEFGWDPYIAPLAERPHILEVRREPQETSSVFGGAWHSDWSFQETPPAATILHAKEVPPTGGDTLFADGRAAWDALSPTFQALLAPLRAVHSAARPYGSEGFYAKESGRIGMTILPSVEAEKTFIHPIARRHPVSGRTALFVNPVYTLGIEGMTAAESAALLGFLFKHMTDEAFVYRHVWSPNMLTMWDNRCLMHNATGGYDGYRRVLHRTTVAGEAPVGV
ncbi:MAG TPA: TauD/TfdA family dioxygenase [Caulobacteraceae bacterium]